MWSVELNNAAPAPDLFRGLRRRKNSFWLDGATGRATCMGFAPSAQLWIGADGVARRRDADGERICSGDPIDALARFVREAEPFDEALVPRTVGYLGYDLAPWVEPRLAARRDGGAGPPLAALSRYDAVAVVSTTGGDPSATHVVVRATDPSAGERLVAALSTEREAGEEAPWGELIEAPAWDEYRSAVAKALDYIAAGDVYQVNLARRFRIASAAPPTDAYLRLRAAQTVPYGAYLDCGAFALLCNSPERFLRVRGRSIRTEPIKGTRRRDPDPETDRRLAATLRADPKERAEHVMIVDLERNDLGRLCERGSVRVESLLRTESFATLHHLVSTVTGTLRPGTDLAAVLRATFPGGSITGAPKIRASEVIAELEPHGRGPYTGAVVWFRREDDFDSAIAIRTAVAERGTYTYHAGGGIVADSDPAREYAECWLKTRPFLRALLGADEAERRLAVPLSREGSDETRGVPAFRATGSAD